MLAVVGLVSSLLLLFVELALAVRRKDSYIVAYLGIFRLRATGNAVS